MNNSWHIGGLLLTVLAALLGTQPQLAAAQNGRGSAAQDAQFTAAGTEGCLRCHSGERMTLMGETAHGDADDPHAPYAVRGCESCHGPGSLHVSRARGGAGFPALLRFGEKSTLPQQTTACLNCHTEDMGETKGLEWTGSAHDTTRITCVSCHQLHTTDNPLTQPKTQTKNCAGCHEDEIATHRRFEDKGITFDKLMCSDCHDVHQLIIEESD